MPLPTIRTAFSATLLGFLVLSHTPAAHADLSPEQLSCEYKTDPLAVDSAHPRLFWKVASRDRGEQQTAYRIIAASSPSRLSSGNADLWDTGIVTSHDTIQLPYAGKQLSSGQQVFWQVRVWDKKRPAVQVEQAGDLDRWTSETRRLDRKVDRSCRSGKRRVVAGACGCEVALVRRRWHDTARRDSLLPKQL